MVAISQQKIFTPPSNRIFVFGSNLRGRHGKGAALHAAKYYGAEEGVAIGHINQCYAIPTKDQMIRPLHIKQVEHFISGFKAYAHTHPNLEFNVTQVGCGLAGFSPEEISKFFINYGPNMWFDPEWQKYLGDKAQYWEQPI